MGIGRFAYTPLLPPMQETLGWTASHAGDVASSNFFGYLAGALAATFLAQRPERLSWLLTGMVLSAATTSAGAVAVSFPVWLAIRFFSGAASALCLVLGTAIVIQFLAIHSRPHLGTLHFAGVGGGIVASVAVIELARLAGFSISGQWGALGIASIALFAGAWTIIGALPNRRKLEGKVTLHASKGQAPANWLLKKLIAAYGLFGFGYIVTATFIVAMARRLDNAAFVEPLTWIVVGLVAAPSVLLWQRAAQRLGMFPALRLAYGLEAAGVLLAGFASGPAAVLIGGALLGGTFMGITALGLSAGRLAAGSDHDRAIGWMTASFGLGQLLGPAVAGRLAEATQGFEAPSMLAALLLIIGMAMLRGMENSLNGS